LFYEFESTQRLTNMKTTIEHTQHNPMPLKPREGRIAPARSVRLRQQGNAFRYQTERWDDLPVRLANAYARFEDKSRNAIRERSLM